MAVAVLALIVESATLNLVFLFLALAALSAGLFAALAFSLTSQVGFFVAASLILPALMRGRLLKTIGGRGVISRTDALLGEKAHVTEHIDPHGGSGRVVVNGHDWAARATEPFAVGTLVEIYGSDGIVLLVERSGPLPDGAPPG